jgi:hypothetical protein
MENTADAVGRGGWISLMGRAGCPRRPGVGTRSSPIPARATVMLLAYCRLHAATAAAADDDVNGSSREWARVCITSRLLLGTTARRSAGDMFHLIALAVPPERETSLLPSPPPPHPPHNTQVRVSPGTAGRSARDFPLHSARESDMHCGLRPAFYIPLYPSTLAANPDPPSPVQIRLQAPARRSITTRYTDR